jgi:ferredoxin
VSGGTINCPCHGSKFSVSNGSVVAGPAPSALAPVSIKVQGTFNSPGVILKGSSDMTYIIALPCVDLLDKTCIDVCPVDCIYEGDRMLYIHPDECVDCGACEPICPVEAISFEADVPAQWKGFYRINVEFFEGIGSPGGASRVGRIGRDHPVVAGLPPQR